MRAPRAAGHPGADALNGTNCRVIRREQSVSPGRSEKHRIAKAYQRRSGRTCSRRGTVLTAASGEGIMQLAALPWAAIAGSVAAGVGVVTFADARRKSRLPELHYAKSRFNKDILARCPSLTAVYRACPLLTNGHVETIFAAVFRKDPGVRYYRRCVIMQDGAAVALDFELLPPEQDLPADAPVALLLPGLTGGSHDVYVQHMVRQVRQCGFRAVVFNGRGTSDSPVTTPQFYSASYTEDTRRVANHLAEQFPDSPMVAVGWSLGANILMRYLGEEGADSPFLAAASLCNPLNLPMANASFERGFNRFYDYRLAQSLSKIYRRHMPLFLRRGSEFDTEMAANCKTIRQFDDAITRVAFGWPSVDAYYEGSSSALSVPHITIPLLCIQAEDDPIAPIEAVPYAQLKANDNCILSVTPTGGHLGWVNPSDVLGAPSVHAGVVEFFSAVLEKQPAAKSTPGQAAPPLAA